MWDYPLRSDATDIPGKFKAKYSKMKDGMRCSDCNTGKILTQSHCMTCPAWMHLREGLDLIKIKHLKSFFRKLLVERTKVWTWTTSQDSGFGDTPEHDEGAHKYCNDIYRNDPYTNYTGLLSDSFCTTSYIVWPKICLKSALKPKNKHQNAHVP